MEWMSIEKHNCFDGPKTQWVIDVPEGDAETIGNWYKKINPNYRLNPIPRIIPEAHQMDLPDPTADEIALLLYSNVDTDRIFFSKKFMPSALHSLLARPAVMLEIVGLAGWHHLGNSGELSSRVHFGECQHPYPFFYYPNFYSTKFNHTIFQLAWWVYHVWRPWG